MAIIWRVTYAVGEAVPWDRFRVGGFSTVPCTCGHFQAVWVNIACGLNANVAIPQRDKVASGGLRRYSASVEYLELYFSGTKHVLFSKGKDSST